VGAGGPAVALGRGVGLGAAVAVGGGTAVTITVTTWGWLGVGALNPQAVTRNIHVSAPSKSLIFVFIPNLLPENPIRVSSRSNRVVIVRSPIFL
jgi:hypothetical protein